MISDKIFSEYPAAETAGVKFINLFKNIIIIFINAIVYYILKKRGIVNYPAAETAGC
jgi:hypothetical protein